MPHATPSDQRHYQRRRADTTQPSLSGPSFLAALLLTLILGAFISAIDVLPLPILTAIALGITLTLIIILIRSAR